MHTAVVITNCRDNDIILLLEVDSAVATCQNTAEIHEAAIDTNKMNNTVINVIENKPLTYTANKH